jgi:hypothetical protein
MMQKTAFAAAIICVFALLIGTADAKPRHHRASHIASADFRTPTGCVFDNDGRQTCRGQNQRIQGYTKVTAAYDGGTVIGGRPAGCPHAFCGCEASRYVFGEMRPDLYLAANWIRKFPRTSPAPGMAAARDGHVFVLISHVEGRKWLVHDGNSGKHLTREHVRSINGYIVVDPHGSRLAMR